MDETDVGRPSEAQRGMDEREARELRCRIKRVAQELEALCAAVAPDARGRMTEISGPAFERRARIGTESSRRAHGWLSPRLSRS
jgi:hypothetical protein